MKTSPNNFQHELKWMPHEMRKHRHHSSLLFKDEIKLLKFLFFKEVENSILNQKCCHFSISIFILTFTIEVNLIIELIFAKCPFTLLCELFFEVFLNTSHLKCGVLFRKYRTFYKRKVVLSEILRANLRSLQKWVVKLQNLRHSINLDPKHWGDKMW